MKAADTEVTAGIVYKGLNGNILKWIALVSMTIDHVGVFLFPEFIDLRILGRLAYPIFAYMIAEGCTYSKHKKRYFSTVFFVGLICSFFSYWGAQSLYQSILITFSISILIIYLLDYAVKLKRRLQYKKSVFIAVSAVMLLGTLYHICNNEVFPGFVIDYGFYGILTPVCIWLGRTKAEKLAMLAVGLLAIYSQLGGIQIYSLAAIGFLSCYNGKRGAYRCKYFFYFYYPLHIALLYGISTFI